MTHYTYNTHTIHTVSQWIHSLTQTNTQTQRAPTTHKGLSQNPISHNRLRVCAHTPQTEHYTHYTPFKRPWIIEFKVFFSILYPLSSILYPLSSILYPPNITIYLQMSTITQQSNLQLTRIHTSTQKDLPRREVFCISFISLIVCVLFLKRGHT